MSFSHIDRRLNPKEGNHKLGNGPFLRLWKAVNKLERKWAGLKLDGGRIETRGDVTRLIVDPTAGGAAVFSGKAYYLGYETTGLASDTSKPWVKLTRSTGVWSQETGPAPQPVPDDEVWREKAGVAGHIYVDR